MSCQSQTIRSMNHSWLRYTSIVPNRVCQGSNMSTPRITNIMPVPEVADRMLGVVRWYTGTGTHLRFSQIRSPVTPFDVQWSRDCGGGKMQGLNHIHNKLKATGIAAHPLIQGRLQNAVMSIGSTASRKITHQGLAWRIHTALSSRKSPATVRPGVIPAGIRFIDYGCCGCCDCWRC
jgi:hypothetical protein